MLGSLPAQTDLAANHPAQHVPVFVPRMARTAIPQRFDMPNSMLSHSWRAARAAVRSQRSLMARSVRLSRAGKSIAAGHAHYCCQAGYRYGSRILLADQGNPGVAGEPGAFVEPS